MSAAPSSPQRKGTLLRKASATKAPRQSFRTIAIEHESSEVKAVTFAPLGKTLAVTYSDGSLLIWEQVCDGGARERRVPMAGR
jgi:hypothetical protein